LSSPSLDVTTLRVAIAEDAGLEDDQAHFAASHP
jgi:hypothetical protein